MPGPGGRGGVPGQKPKDAKKTFKRILTYMGKSKKMLFFKERFRKRYTWTFHLALLPRHKLRSFASCKGHYVD